MINASEKSGIQVSKKNQVLEIIRYKNMYQFIDTKTKQKRFYYVGKTLHKFVSLCLQERRFKIYLMKESDSEISFLFHTCLYSFQATNLFTCKTRTDESNATEIKLK